MRRSLARLSVAPCGQTGNTLHYFNPSPSTPRKLLPIEGKLPLLKALGLRRTSRVLVSSKGIYFRYGLLLIRFELPNIRRQKRKSRCHFVRLSVRCVIAVGIDENKKVWQFRFIEAGFS